MKIMKSLFLSFALLLSASAFATNGAFINNQIPDWAANDGAKVVNPRGDLLIVDENPSAFTIALTYRDGSVENWVFSNGSDYNTILDRFQTGGRSQGNDFYYTNTYGSNGHRRIPYTAIRKATCAKTPGVEFYTTTIVLVSGTTIVSNGYSINYCLYLN